MVAGLLLSCCNVKAPFGRYSLVYLRLSDERLFFIDLSKIQGIQLRVSGVTGLVRQGDQIFAGLQTGGASRYAVFDRHMRLSRTFAQEGIRDLHGIRDVDGELLVVSTATNAVFRIDPTGIRPPDLYWQAPVGDEEDRIHLNEFIVHEGRRLALVHGLMDNPEGRNGAVYDIDSGDVLLSGLKRPHTMFEIDGRLGVCDSHNGKIIMLDRPEEPVFEEEGSFLRGLAVLDDMIVVASSGLRIFSRSKGFDKRYGYEDPVGNKLYMSSLYFLNRDFSIRSKRSFTEIASEVYDILPLEEEPAEEVLIADPAVIRVQAMAKHIADLEIDRKAAIAAGFVSTLGSVERAARLEQRRRLRRAAKGLPPLEPGTDYERKGTEQLVE